MPQTPPCVLTVAGSDSSGGAGIQADLKTVFALGGHAASVVCAVTAQNSHGVQGSWEVPAAAVRAQFAAVLGDIAVQAVKTGMLASAANAAVAADVLATVAAPLVVDPVMASSHGEPLVTPEALAVIRERLLPLATVITPNLGEAEMLTGIRAGNESQMAAAAAAIHSLGPRWVLVTGGHLAGGPVDVLFDGERVRRYPGSRVDSPHTHGTGCTLASAIATHLAFGSGVPAAVARAKEFVATAIRSGFPLGRGTGPVDQGWRWRDGAGGRRAAVSG